MPELDDSQKTALDRILDVPKEFAADIGGGKTREPPPPGRSALHMSPLPDPEPEESVAEPETDPSSPEQEHVAETSDRYAEFAEHAGQPAADALKEIHQAQSEPTANDWAQVIKKTYGSKYPKLGDAVTVGEVLLEFTDLATALEADENTSPDMDLEQVLALAVKNVLDSDAADDEIIGRLLDGERHLIPAKIRDRQAHAEKRRARAAELLGHNAQEMTGQHPQNTAADEEDRILQGILDRAEAGHVTEEIDRKSTGGRSIGLPLGGMGINE